MKDIVITQPQIKKEAQRWGLCFLIALSINALSIVYFKTHWIELVTSLHVTFGIACILYFLSILIRIARSIVLRFFQRGA